MKARVPLDVDLEDKLILGLSPIRFGYLVVAAVTAFTAWSHASLPAPARWLCAVGAAGLGVALAWGRWRGRSLDRLALDAVEFARLNYRLEMAAPRRLRNPGLRLPKLRSRRPAGAAAEAEPPLRTIAVAGTEPGAGSTTVAIEVAVSLAAEGRRVSLYEVGGSPAGARRRLGMKAAGRHPESGVEVKAGFSDPKAGAGEAPGALLVLDLGRRHVSPSPDLTLLVVPVGLPPPDVIASELRSRPGRAALVVNRHGGDPMRARGQAEPDAEVIAVIPDDAAVPAAEVERAPTVLAFPTSPAAAAFRRLADLVANDEPPVSA